MVGMLTSAGLRLGFDSGDNTSTAITVAIVAISVYLALYWMQTRKAHPDEPPIVASPVPFVGHILGMAIWGGRYIKSIGARNSDKPIFTLPISPRSRIYIVTDPSLAAAVQRASRTLSFTPLVPDLTKRVLGLDAATVAIVRQNLDTGGFLSDMHDLVYTALGPGESLTSLTSSAATELATQISTFAKTLPITPEGSKQQQISLLPWTRAIVTAATAGLLYGPSNPLRTTPSLTSALWAFDAGIPSLLLSPHPCLTARKAFLAREALADAFTQYLTDNQHAHAAASPLVRKRVDTAQRHGLSLHAAARSEVSFLFAAVVNSAMAGFWVLARVFADRDLLELVRGEVTKAVVVDHTHESNDTDTEEEGEGVIRLHLDKLLNDAACAPTLRAVLRECLRTTSENLSTRLVTHSTVLAGKWFLAQGSVVQVAGGVVHRDRRVWGSDADEFAHARFLAHDGDGGDGGQKQAGGNQGSVRADVHPAAFRAFGGGKTLCPGRHFATSEVVVLVAMVVLMFELEAVDGGGVVVVPEKKDAVLPVHILEPTGQVELVVRRREGAGRIVVV
ncbi:cytochrome P450 [Podospora appendiculata]|uniref:Cytochrome P450 n=1 Tax=Podospora appendiculata TaxID=314037 RepID=A0AAE0X131_9PEZI|nr:cytochrome P450 [Podospora appendiculata]